MSASSTRMYGQALMRIFNICGGLFLKRRRGSCFAVVDAVGPLHFWHFSLHFLQATYGEGDEAKILFVRDSPNMPR